MCKEEKTKISADESLRSRSESYFSDPLHIPGGQRVDLSTIDVASFVNTSTPHTHFRVPSEKTEEFNAVWRQQLRKVFDDAKAADELREWEETGLSRGRSLKLNVMAVKPGEYFRVHAHPNIEFEMTLAGTLKEIRMKDVFSLDKFTETESGLEGPNLGSEVAVKRTEQGADAGDFFYHATVAKGEVLANTIGSLHQSYTDEEGALIVVLWSGCHANVRPEKCQGLADVLRPSAGWNCSCYEK